MVTVGFIPDRHHKTLIASRSDASIPEVALVVFDPVPLKECEIFLLIRLRPMMLPLVPDVFRDIGDIWFANGERPIAVLPGETAKLRKCRLYPAG